jgi:hypothetical protein
MAPMKRPADPRHSPYHGTWSLGKAARHFAMPKKQLRRLLGSGQLEFVQIEGQIRIPIEVAARFSAETFSAEAWSGTMATIKRATN